MKTRKSHHYVPQFYLRNFSSTENGKEIGLYNHKRNVFVAAAPIKHQACEKFLYGIDDEIEAALSRLEHLTAITLQILLQALSPPPEETPYYKILIEFLLYQMSRTVKAGKDTNNMLSIGMKEAFKLTSHYNEEKHKGLMFIHKEPTLLSLLYSSQGLPLMKYLSCKLIVNESTIPFITSDNPVVKYNQFLETKGLTHGTTGIASKGLQIFFPINPLLLLVFYDPKTYKLNTRNETTIITNNDSDIYQLNGLQYINSDSQLFFGPGIDKIYFETLSNKYEKIKTNCGPISQSFKTGNLDNGKESYLLLGTHKEAQINLSLSFVKLTKGAKHYALGDKLVHVRHSSFAEWGRKNKQDFFTLDA